jgi:hypothetical protein
MAKQLYSATIFFSNDTKMRPRKYRNISNKISFIKFAEKINGGHINFYCQNSKDFIYRHYIKDYRK